MNEQQKKAATAIALAIVTAAALFFLWLALEVLRGAAIGDAVPGRLFMLAVANWGGLGIALKSLPILLSVGLSFLGGYALKDSLFYSLVAVSVLGAAAAVYLYMEVGSFSTAQGFWAYSPTDDLENYGAFVAAAHKGLGVVIAWFLAVILAELGIKKIGFP